MSTRRFIAGAVCALALAGPAAAQQDPAQRVEAALQRARAAGIPVELLESKIAEGRAKGVPMERIALAVEHRATALTRAREVLGRALEGDGVAAEDVAVGADALQAGVSEAVLARIAVTSGRERRTVAIAALTHLVTNGHGPEEAMRSVEAAMARGNEALMNLPGMAGRGRDGGGPPAGVPAAGRPPGQGGPPAGKPGGKPGGSGG